MPLNYSSTSTFRSILCPEVTYKLRKISHGRRVKLNIDIAETIAKINEFQQSLVPIQEDIDRAEAAAKIEPCTCKHDLSVQVVGVDLPHDKDTGRCSVPGCECRKPRPDLGGYEVRLKTQTDIMELVLNKLYPAYIIWGVQEVQGLKIDEVDATPQSIVDSGPEPLVYELGEEIQRLIKLPADEVLGFKSPTTSDGQVGGQTSGTIAPSVNGITSTPTDTAAAISQS